jgi:hypothetical protein
MIGQDRHWNRLRLSLEQQDENRELEIAQPVTSTDTPETAVHSFGGAKIDKSETATRDVDPVSPAGEREKCAR